MREKSEAYAQKRQQKNGNNRTESCSRTIERRQPNGNSQSHATTQTPSENQPLPGSLACLALRGLASSPSSPEDDDPELADDFFEFKAAAARAAACRGVAMPPRLRGGFYPEVNQSMLQRCRRFLPPPRGGSVDVFPELGRLFGFVDRKKRALRACEAVRARGRRAKVKRGQKKKRLFRFILPASGALRRAVGWKADNRWSGALAPGAERQLPSVDEGVGLRSAKGGVSLITS